MPSTAIKTRNRTRRTDPLICGVRMSAWPTDELLMLPWHMVMHLTVAEKRKIVERATREKIPLPRRKEW